MRASVNAARNRQAVPSQTHPNILELRKSIADVGECVRKVGRHLVVGDSGGGGELREHVAREARRHFGGESVYDRHRT